MNYSIPLEAEKIYHIYNRAVGSDLLFIEKRNYEYFLEKYFGRFEPYLDTIAYCLIPNHFHILAKVKKDTIPEEISLAFKGFFIGYSQAINRQEKRRGSLMMKPFKRKEVESNDYLTALFAYIHLNPWIHNPQRDFKTYQWSSYQSILSGNDRRLNRDFTLDWFGGIQPFLQYHDESLDFRKLEKLKLE